MTNTSPSNHSFRPGQIWHDTSGKPINAHSGGIIYHKEIYYWYGECRPVGHADQDALTGVSCYQSKDLYNWENRGVVLPVVHNDAAHPLTAGCKIERPKVLYNELTKKFVMWWHHDIKGWGHHGALAGVAVSDTPTGPFQFIEILRPHGTMFRDCTLFKDEDHCAYLIYATDDNCNLMILKLNEDYLKPSQHYLRIFPGRYMEAPCLWKHENQYYFIGSGCTGWAPNEARSATAHALFSQWNELGNPALGEGAEITFGAQSTCVFPVVGKSGAYIFMADIWNPENLADSQYVWLPVEFRTLPVVGPRPFVRWRDEWDLSWFSEQIRPSPKQS